MEKSIKFLKTLKKNNNKDWFNNHKDQYLEAKEEFETVVNELIKSIIKFDKKISNDLQAKDCVFRIYKDVRFSKDKSPYKTNMGASINPGGKKSMIPGYYFHLEPGNSFLAGGIYMPEPQHLAAVRQEIDYNGAKLEKILKSKTYTNYFQGLDESDKLKTVPKGYDKNNKYIELLKFKNFIAFHKINDSRLNSKTINKYVTEGFKSMLPLLEFLREAVE